MGTKALITVEKFAQIHTADPEDYELVEVELIALSSATPRHVKANVEVDCLLDSDEIRRPDVSSSFGERAYQIDLDRISRPCLRPVSQFLITLQ